jgi:hypothetical protein
MSPLLLLLLLVRESEVAAAAAAGAAGGASASAAKQRPEQQAAGTKVHVTGTCMVLVSAASYSSMHLMCQWLWLCQVSPPRKGCFQLGAACHEMHETQLFRIRSALAAPVQPPA